eukprot:5284441-Karenia_brevis.AAC.2
MSTGTSVTRPTSQTMLQDMAPTETEYQWKKPTNNGCHCERLAMTSDSCLKWQSTALSVPTLRVLHCSVMYSV